MKSRLAAFSWGFRSSLCRHCTGKHFGRRRIAKLTGHRRRGWTVPYLTLRAGKLAFGRQRKPLPGVRPELFFTDTALFLPEKEISYAELFYRKSDVIALQARTVELAGRRNQNVPVRLTPASLQIGSR